MNKRQKRRLARAIARDIMTMEGPNEKPVPRIALMKRVSKDEEVSVGGRCQNSIVLVIERHLDTIGKEQ